MLFHLFYASCRGDAKNTSYPFKKKISSLDDLVKVAAYDHVGCRFKTGRNNKGTKVEAYRNNKTFYSADVIIMDVDNMNKDPLKADLTEAQWTMPKDVAEAFPNVPFYVVYSRNHMKSKNGQPPRPKFHVYFPLHQSVTDYMRLEDLKKKIQRKFPAFDPNAIKVTQFMFGVEEPKAESYEGKVFIDQFIKAKKQLERAERLPEVITEGQRNETLSKYAGKVITRLGDTNKAREAFDKAADRCSPALEIAELDIIWQSAQRFYHDTVLNTPGYVEPDDYFDTDGYDEGSDGSGDSGDKRNKFDVDDMKAILKALKINVRYNILLKKLEATGLPKTSSKGNTETTLTALIMGYMSRKGLHCSNRAFDNYLGMIVDENRYNPIQEMLDETVWDGKDYISELINLIIEANARETVYVTKWLHQCIALGLNDEDNPVSAAGVLVFQGEQGIGKTMLCSKLAVCREWFGDGKSIDMSNKDNIIQATARWIVELGELDSTLKHEQSALKAFLTSPEDTYRMPYARSATTQPRRTSFCGTVNPKEFLNDETGSRRFWVVSGDHINLKRVLALDANWAKQLWRQVYETLYLPNPTGFCLTQEEMRFLQLENETYAKMLPGEIEVRDKLDFNAQIDKWRWMKVSELTEGLNAKGITSMHIGKVLAKLKRSDKRIELKNCNGQKQYLLPPFVNSYNYISSGNNSSNNSFHSEGAFLE